MFVFMVIMLLILCCCGCIVFIQNQDLPNKIQLGIKAPFTVCNFCTILFFIVAGAVLLGSSSAAKKVLNYACEQEEKGGTIGNAVNFFSRIYNTSDTFYCTTSACAC